MRILPISNNMPKPGFNGKYEKISNSNEIHKLPDWHPASSLEKTLDAFHANKTNKVYFASPMEPISDNIKEAADYIVYDNEPMYPDIDEIGLNYFNNLRVDFNKDFKERKHYFERRKFAGFASQEEAQREIDKADNCIRLYDNGGHLRYVKETAEDKIIDLENDNSEIKQGIQTANNELSKQQLFYTDIEKHTKNLEELKKPYKKILSSGEKSSESETAMYDAAALGTAAITAKLAAKNKYETFLKDAVKTYSNITDGKDKDFSITNTKEKAQKEYKQLEETTARYNSIKDTCNKNIKNLQNHIKYLQNKILENDNQIKEKKSLIEDCKKKLIPIFDELKYFYANNGIKGLKKLK